MNEYDLIIEALANGVPDEEISQILNENKFDENHRETQSFYLLTFEQYMDECAAYSFDGWKDISIYGEPVIEKFWVEFILLCPAKFDYEGGTKRILGEYNQNKAVIKKTRDGRNLLKLRILRSILDEIEENNRKLARKKAEEAGYAPVKDQDKEEEGGFDNDDFNDSF